MNTAIAWFRRDLRLADNPALAAALEGGRRVVAVYVHAPDEEGAWRPGAASRWWLDRSLRQLAAELERRGSGLIVRRGHTLPTLLAIARETGATAIHWNRLYEPQLVARDTAVKAALLEQGVDAVSHAGHLLFEPWTVRTGGGEPYRVFTPFWRNCSQSLGALGRPLPPPGQLRAPGRSVAGEPVESLALAPAIRWDAGLAASWSPGEAGAHATLQRFVDEALAGYADGRNRPDRAATSRLSPHLHFGELSPRQVVAALEAAGLAGGAGVAGGTESCIRELGWREFAHHLLYHFPHTTDAPLDARFEGLDWQRDARQLESWQRGRTGYPIVDAGMRELWHTGWMHNRVRMIAASLLTKNLFMHWREGARWFWDTLVDADLASNTLGWQWTAGCGADAAPYYRIFNPVLQSERFDPDRAYIRRWVPELAALPDRWIHQPWAAPPEVLATAGVRLGHTYPGPIVEFRASREQALGRYAALKSAATITGESATLPDPKKASPATGAKHRSRRRG
jgi:deoxyribodipyrimidine photo-lyase